MAIHANPRIPALALVGCAATAAFAGLAFLERDRRLSAQDRKALAEIARRAKGQKPAAEKLHPVGKWWAYLPAAVVIGAVVYARGRGGRLARVAGAAAVPLAAAINATLNPLFDKFLPQPPPPPARRANPKPTFPSGHASGLGAVGLTAAYVLSREEVVGPGAAVPIALLPPLVGGLAKIVEKKHWPSEVAGGLLVGVAVASLSGMAYEVARGR
jgi:membrane-associated phospholipid phosphatase